MAKDWKKASKGKYLYTFSVKKRIEKEVEEISTDKDGNEIKITKKIQDVGLEKIDIRRATRRMYDDAELYYGVQLSEGIKAGLLTKALLAKRFEDDGGTMSDREKKEYFEVYYSLLDKENDYQKAQLNLDNLDPEPKEKKLLELLYDILELRKQLRDIEEAQSSLFNQTAENRARNQTLMWWVIHLGYMNGEPIFLGDTYEQKLNVYDAIEDEDDEFLTEVIKKLAYFVSFWYSGQASEKEDFDRALEIYTEGNPTELYSKEEQRRELEGAATVTSAPTGAEIREEIIKSEPEPEPKPEPEPEPKPEAKDEPEEDKKNEEE